MRMKHSKFYLILLIKLACIVFIKCAGYSIKGNYFKIEQNTAIEELPKKIVSANLLTRCLEECSKLGHYIVSVDDDITNTDFCYCYNDMQDSKKRFKAKSKLIYKIDTCFEYPTCRHKTCSTSTRNKHMNGLPCKCFFGEICFSKDGIIKNLAIEGIASTSSAFLDYTGNRSIDGRLDNFTQTLREVNPWVAVQLKHPAKIYKVIVYNADSYWHKFRMNPLSLFIGSSERDLPEYVNGFDASQLTFIELLWDSSPAIGKYVKLQVTKPDGIMNLLEILIYGHYV